MIKPLQRLSHVVLLVVFTLMPALFQPQRAYAGQITLCHIPTGLFCRATRGALSSYPRLLKVLRTCQAVTINVTPAAVAGHLQHGDFLGKCDPDGDGVRSDLDNCPTRRNANQADADNDGVGDVCDNCPQRSNANQADADADGVGT